MPISQMIPDKADDDQMIKQFIRFLPQVYTSMTGMHPFFEGPRINPPPGGVSIYCC